MARERPGRIPYDENACRVHNNRRRAVSLGAGSKLTCPQLVAVEVILAYKCVVVSGGGLPGQGAGGIANYVDPARIDCNSVSHATILRRGELPALGGAELLGPKLIAVRIVLAHESV